ncbi:SIMPL domain-containing protein [Flavobacterium pallidum]|uniref:DUF541 domain-containing protein n=1 Tax=Flavobacterium pallidum TaxID=2172098 RepID=A0A2S1SJ78_9FLAO|nr:SIMPL domain-containing protein [Flavobacterium pallidum]AWI26468.1 hypothetical protein HYN49_11445 [Flavobacterium pallidum]
MKTTFIAGFLFLNLSSAQHTGNQLYANPDGNSGYAEVIHNAYAEKITDNGAQLIYRMNILDNIKADSYVVTLGLNQEATSPKECNAKINKRIDGFKSALKKWGIDDDDIAVDFISQTKIYDFKAAVNGAQTSFEEQEKGFEIKKNIIIRLHKMTLFDELVESASEFDIYNIAKVDYFCKDQQKVYDSMLSEANKILEIRKTASNKDINNPDLYGKPKISINFYSIQPANQYKKYTAYESADVVFKSDYYSDKSYVKQEERKSNTFYYDGRQPDLYDSVLNADTPMVGLQYVMEVVVTYTKY